MKKYGLQLRAPPSQQIRRPPLPTASIFGDDDDDNVEKDISRQASKKKSLKDIEEQHKKALEEDPSAFAYDDVYDEIKQKTALPKMQEREERKPRYIQHLMKKAEERQREQDVIYERKLAKERNQDEHLYADKDKFITSAYKRKLAEQAKWMEEQRLRDLQEEKDDVTKKKDLSDFYFNLGKNVAFGASEAEERNRKKLEDLRKAEDIKKAEDVRKAEEAPDENKAETSEKDQTTPPASFAEATREKEHGKHSTAPGRSPEHQETKTDSDKPPVSDKLPASEGSTDEPKPNHHKKSEDAIAAAKERFLARKKAKIQ